MAKYKNHVRGGSKRKRQDREVYCTESPWAQLNNRESKFADGQSSYNNSDREGEHLQLVSKNANNNNFSRGRRRGKMRHAQFTGGNIPTDSESQIKSQINASSLATSFNKGRTCLTGASICTINKSQEHKDLPNFCAVTAEHETDKSVPDTPKVNKDGKLPVTSGVGKLKLSDDFQNELKIKDARINKDNELIRTASVGTASELKNLLDLCHNSLSLQLSQETLESSLILTVRRGQKFMVQLLLYAGAQPASNFKDKDGYTALLIAAEKGFTDIARLLLKKGANVNAINNNMDSALLLSVKPWGSTELMTLLLSHKANVNLKNKDGYTVLMKALEVRDFDTIKLLVDAGAEVDAIKSRRKSVNTIANKLGISYMFSLIIQEPISKNRKQSTALIKAVLSGNVEAVRLLLDCQFTDINVSDQNGTALMQFVNLLSKEKMCNAKLEILKVLLQNGADTGSNWLRESNVFCVAARAGRSDVIRLLYEYGTGRNDYSAYKLALMTAAECGHLEVLGVLMEYSEFVADWNLARHDALLSAMKYGQVDCAKFLLIRGPHLDYLQLTEAIKMTLENKQSEAFQFLASQYKIDVNKENLLHLAVENDMEDIVNIMINMGADVNKVGCDRRTPLEKAFRCHTGEALIKCLIKNGACVNGSGDFYPLHLSLHYSVEFVRLLLESGAEVNERGNYSQDTALIAACDNGVDIEIVKLFLAKGVQLNLQNAMGWTALHKATYQANVDLVQLLVESGADLEVQTHKNETAYLLAAEIGNLKLIEFFQNHRANKFVVDSSGYNALMRACRHPYSSVDPSTLSLLAHNKASINHQCDKGFTALMLIAKAGNATLMKSLLDLGADVNITNSFIPNGKKETALSIMLEKSYNYSKKEFSCIEELIRHGAVNSLPSWCNDVLHKMIRLDNRKMIQLLLTNGMAPTMDMSPNISLYSLASILQLPMSTSTTETSPLSLALTLGNIQVAEYLVSNWALCPCDLTVLSQPRNNLDSHRMSESSSVKFVDKFFSQPGSLLQLSFVAVSHALGGVPGREERVNILPIPQVIKDKLMFRNEVVQMDFTEDLSLANSNNEIQYNLDADYYVDDLRDYSSDSDIFTYKSDYDTYGYGSDSDDCHFYGFKW